jgi:hypothetical protein
MQKYSNPPISGNSTEVPVRRRNDSTRTCVSMQRDKVGSDWVFPSTQGSCIAQKTLDCQAVSGSAVPTLFDGVGKAMCIFLHTGENCIV